jgi:hypothetical protein
MRRRCWGSGGQDGSAFYRPCGGWEYRVDYRTGSWVPEPRHFRDTTIQQMQLKVLAHQDHPAMIVGELSTASLARQSRLPHSQEALLVFQAAVLGSCQSQESATTTHIGEHPVVEME